MMMMIIISASSTLPTYCISGSVWTDI